MAGWVSVTAGIVSKRLNLSENFLDHLVGPSFEHLGPLTPIPNSTGNPFVGGVKHTGVGKLAIFFRFSTYIAVYLGNGVVGVIAHEFIGCSRFFTEVIVVFLRVRRLGCARVCVQLSCLVMQSVLCLVSLRPVFNRECQQTSLLLLLCSVCERCV